MFKEIALQVCKGNSSLKFPHAEWHLLIAVSSQPPPGQIQSPRYAKLSTTSSLLLASWDSTQGLPSIACALLRNLHVKWGSSTSLPGYQNTFCEPRVNIHYRRSSSPRHLSCILQKGICQKFAMYGRRYLPKIIALVLPMFNFNPFHSR